jgi:uroporphyrinogen decarboxylase
VPAGSSLEMTSRELVRRTLEFASPARIPRQLWLLPWAVKHYPDQVEAIQRRFPDDIVSSPPFYAAPLPGSGDAYRPGIFVDEWGCRFENVQEGIIGEVRTPLLADWRLVDTVRIPEERLSVDSASVNEFCRRSDRFVLSGCCPRPFERLQFLRGTEKLFVDLVRRPAELDALIRRIHAFYLDELELWAGTQVDALSMMDDWGSQRAMLVSPTVWRELFKPLYAEYIALAHRYGKYMFMHSDGYILDILPDLIELGLDALNCQVACMGIHAVGQRCAGRITLWGEVDRQHLLPHGTRQDVFATVQAMKTAFHRDGGVIGQCEFGPGAKPENVHALFEAWDAA